MLLSAPSDQNRGMSVIRFRGHFPNPAWFLLDSPKQGCILTRNTLQIKPFIDLTSTVLGEELVSISFDKSADRPHLLRDPSLAALERVGKEDMVHGLLCQKVRSLRRRIRTP